MRLDKNYKVRVNPKQSRKIQELVFGLGGKWNGGTDWVINEIIPFLYVTSGLVMTCDSKAQEYFGYASSENTEIQADDLIALLTDLSKSAENPLQDMKLTPEFETEVSEPTFKAGDPVYFPRLSNKLCVIGEGQEDDYVDEVNGLKALAKMQSGLDFVYDQKTKLWLWNEKDCAPQLLHATPKNYELLSKLHPHLKFEQPPKLLSGDELVRAMLTKGIKNVLCLWGSGDKIIIDRLDYKGSLMSTNCHIVGGLTPIDWCTGEPLTQAVLDE